MAFLVKGTNIVGGKIEEGGASALADLTDVQLTTPTDGQALVYDSELQKFINGDVADPQVFDTDNNGLTPASGDDDETKFLRNDGEWAEPVEKITPEYYYAHKEELEASGKTYMVSGTISGTMEAENVGYDNSTSGLSSTNLQDAVDELVNGGLVAENIGYNTSNVEAALDGLIDKTTLKQYNLTALLPASQSTGLYFNCRKYGNLVDMTFWGGFSSQLAQGWTTLSNLPQEILPLSAVYVSCTTLHASSGSALPGIVRVLSDNRLMIYLSSTLPANSFIGFNLVYWITN